MDWAEFSKKTVKQINKELKRLWLKWRSEVERIDKKLLPLVDKFIASCQGGKRIRGSLVVLGYEIARSKIKDQRSKLEDIFKVAAAYEIFHTAVLAHDDIIDQSPLRRGQPSLYQALGGDHDGVSQAICLGDAGFFLAIKTIAESSISEALRWFSQVMLDTAMGEMLDVGKGDITAIMKFKTARYSVSGPLILGAILGGAKVHLGGVPSTSLRATIRGEQLDNLDQFGENLGIAFQIQDDILGVFGSAEQTGKSITSDIEEGKNTILSEQAFKKASKQQYKILKKLYGRGKINNQEVETVRQIFQETGVLNHAKKAAEKYKNRALKVLPEITKERKMSKLLQQLAEYLVRRSK